MAIGPLADSQCRVDREASAPNLSGPTRYRRRGRVPPSWDEPAYHPHQP
jgi:hypothetical protein